MFPDPDDMLSDNILHNCYQIAKNNNYEMIRFNIYYGNKTLFNNKIIDKLKSEGISDVVLLTCDTAENSILGSKASDGKYKKKY